jgi:hypothetical protein
LAERIFAPGHQFLFGDAPVAELFLDESELLFQSGRDLQVFFDFEVAFLDRIEDLVVVHMVLQMLIGKIKEVGDFVVFRLALSGRRNDDVTAGRIAQKNGFDLLEFLGVGEGGAPELADFKHVSSPFPQ